MSDKLKKLTGKNPKDFEPVAYSVINNSDCGLFSELVSQDDFLFDFVKQNVANRLAKVCNESNYLNLLNFLKYYSPSYEDFIVSTLAKYADEDLTDKMLEIFENGTEDEKVYCAKFFSYIQDPLAIEFLNKYAYSENLYLSGNCASTLALLGEVESYNKALEMLKSSDDFEVLSAVKFLVAYGNKDAVADILKVMKKSSLAENIAGELLYLIDLFALYEVSQVEALYVLNLVISALGEILGLSQVFDFQLYDFIEMIINSKFTPESVVVLNNACDKFNTLTENDEYLYDETKDTKQEVYDIKNLLNKIDFYKFKSLLDTNIDEDSLFVATALDFTENMDKVRMLLSSSNQTLVLKSLEVLKKNNSMTENDRVTAYNSVSNQDLKNVIMAI